MGRRKSPRSHEEHEVFRPEPARHPGAGRDPFLDCSDSGSMSGPSPRMRLITCLRGLRAFVVRIGAVDSGDKNKVGTPGRFDKMGTPTRELHRIRGDLMAGSVNKVILVGNLGR